jgi:hypothetical protein
MNLKLQRNMRYFRVKLRPLVMRREKNGRWLEPKDDVWIVQSVSARALHIKNTRTDHVIDLSSDAIHDFRISVVDPSFEKDKQGILKLLGYVWLCGDRAGFEPLSLPSAEKVFLKQMKLA